MLRTRLSTAATGVIVVVLAASLGVASFGTSEPVSAGDDAGPSGNAGDVPTADTPVLVGRVSGAALAHEIASPSPLPGGEPLPNPFERIGLSPELVDELITQGTIDASEQIDGAAEDPAAGSPPASDAVAPTSTTTTVASTTTTAAAPATTTTTTTSPPPPPPTTTTTTTPPTTTSTTAADGGPRDVEEWRALVAVYFPPELVDDALSVIDCESNGDPLAENPTSGAAGLFQFIPSTWEWASENAGLAGTSPFDPEANVAVAAWLVEDSISSGHAGGPWGHWSCKP